MEQTSDHFSSANGKAYEYAKSLAAFCDELFEINFDDDVCRLLHRDGAEVFLSCAETTFSEFIRDIGEHKIFPADKTRFLNFFNEKELRANLSAGAKRLTGEFRKFNDQGGYVWLSLTIVALNPKSERQTFLCCLTYLDTKDLAALPKNADMQNNFDQLTGLPSRSLFFERARLLLQQAEDQYAVIVLDINQFKLINDFFGIHTGDRLLCHVATLLDRYFRQQESSVYCRLESDRFAVCCPYTEYGCDAFVTYIAAGLRECPLNFELSPYFGFYLPKALDITVNTMCDRARLALKTIKGKFDRNYAVYEDSMLETLLYRQEITNSMRQGLQQKQFEIYLQPKVNLLTSEIVGAEALVRWNHPVRGLLPPAEFIGIFEENGFITELDAFVWEEACRLQRKWLDRGCNPLPLSVNISRVDLINPGFYETLTGLIEKYKLEPGLLELELTKTSYVKKYDEIKNVTKRLHDYGFSVHMDDFGSGYSSLNMLQDVAVDTLKIDVGFISGFEESGRSRNILSSVIRMAKWLKLPVIIEGVETKQQVAFLKSIGCTVAQGYYFSKPVTVERFETELACKISADTLSCDQFCPTKINIEDVWKPTSAFNLLFDSLPYASAIYEYTDCNLELLRANDHYFDLLGVPRERLYFAGTHLLDYIHKDDRQPLITSLPRSIEQSPVLTTCRRVTSEGELVSLQTKIHFLANDGQRLLFYASIKVLPTV
ncbi:MAG: EAL domain-containing protein [Acholeplasmataceae bacterium]|nr:EAL domain-containing protein [Acholeplasmataceae bacterium]